MKRQERQMLTALAVAWFAALGSARAQSDSHSTSQPDGGRTAPAIHTDALTLPAERSNPFASVGPDQTSLTLNLRGVPVDAVLNYLSEAAGFTIIREANTQFDGTVDIVSANPLDKAEIVLLLNKVLAQHGLAALQDGRSLAIMTVHDAELRNLTPVLVWDNHAASIPQDARIVTEVISLHSLNPSQVVKDLSSLLPPEANVSASEGANAIVMTARQSDIRRFAQIIQALDLSGETDLQVFSLEFADAKAVAQELKDVFTAPDANASQSNPFQNLPGNRGGGVGAAANPRRSPIRVNAVSDGQNNAVLVSAPTDMMPGISNLIHRLDIQQDDLLQIRLFGLHHADAEDVANQMSLLFPNPATQSSPQNNSRGPGAQFVGGQLATSTGADISDRRKKQSTVIAVPDPRTQSVIITASKDTMGQIANIIADLDSNAAGIMQIYVYRAKHADVLDLQGPLSDLFASASRTTSSSQINALAQRANQAAQNSPAVSSAPSLSVGGSPGGR